MLLWGLECGLVFDEEQQVAVSGNLIAKISILRYEQIFIFIHIHIHPYVWDSGK